MRETSYKKCLELRLVRRRLLMDLAGLEWGRGGGIGGRGAGAAQVPLWTPLLALPHQLQEPSRERTPPKLDGHCAEQPGVMTKVSFPWVPC